MNKFLICVMPLTINACAIPAGIETTSPAPLAATVVDDRALKTAWLSFEVAVDSISLLRKSGAIVAGSAKAIRVANSIDRITAALTACEHLAKAGSATNYAVALGEAQSAIAELRVVLRSN